MRWPYAGRHRRRTILRPIAMLATVETFDYEEVNEALHRLARQDPYFVQVGAMDGVSFDPIHPFIANFKWAGLLVEPMPEQFSALKKNYAAHTNLKFSNEAVAEHDGTITLRYLDPAYVADGRLPREVLGMSTTVANPNHFLHEAIRPDLRPILQEAQRTMEVPCLTLPNLLLKYDVRRIDLFMCDVEGADWMVLKQLDLSVYKPQIVFFEYDVMTEGELNACIKYFTEHGYTAKKERPPGQNMVFMRPQGGPRLMM